MDIKVIIHKFKRYISYYLVLINKNNSMMIMGDHLSVEIIFNFKNINKGMFDCLDWI